ncbi:hypothetical protein C8A05DRAFT_31935, partial [Staphylotrichum tortipilum]
MAEANKIPTVMVLKSDQNIAAWKEAIRSCFLVHGLSKFLDGTAHEPAAGEAQDVKDAFIVKKAIAHAVIRQSVEPVMDVIKPFGWQDGVDDPKGLYDMAIRAVSGVSEETWQNLYIEFTDINPLKFDNLRAFNTRYHFLVNKLSESGVTYSERAKTANLMKAIRKWDTQWADMLSFHVSSDKLKYDELVKIVTTRANEQAMHNMVAVTDQQTKKSSSGKPNNNQGGKPSSNNTSGTQMKESDMPCRKEELKEAYDRRSQGQADASNPKANRAVFSYDSGVMDGINN